MKILTHSFTILALVFIVTGCSMFSSPAVQTVSSTDSVEQRYFALARVQPENPDPWFRLGNWYAEQNQLEQAEHAYQQALQRDEHTGALHNLGLIRIRLGVKSLQQAGQKLPEDDPTHAETKRFLQAILEAAL